jgi:two-component system OmpR family response regulator
MPGSTTIPATPAPDPRVLVIEDDDAARRALALGLHEAGCEVLEAADGLAGLAAATQLGPDIVLLDLRLPKLDGQHVLQRLRQVTAVPVIVVSAKRTEEDRIAALDLGADDYLVKPFGIRELLARIRAVLRRTTADANAPVTIGDLAIDFPSCTALRAGERILLTAQEFAALACLVQHRGQLVTRELLEEAVHPQRHPPTDAAATDHVPSVSNIVDVIVLRLRKKLGHDLITTRRGLGFMIDG